MPINDNPRMDYNYEICLFPREDPSEPNPTPSANQQVCAGLFLGSIDDSGRLEASILRVPVTPMRAAVEGNQCLMWRIEMATLQAVDPDAGTVAEICDQVFGAPATTHNETNTET
jgi:hypothetical protein